MKYVLQTARFMGIFGKLFEIERMCAERDGSMRGIYNQKTYWVIHKCHGPHNYIGRRVLTRLDLITFPMF